MTLDVAQRNHKCEHIDHRFLGSDGGLGRFWKLELQIMVRRIINREREWCHKR